jgi:hypothetical protein
MVRRLGKTYRAQIPIPEDGKEIAVLGDAIVHGVDFCGGPRSERVEERDRFMEPGWQRATMSPSAGARPRTPSVSPRPIVLVTIHSNASSDGRCVTRRNLEITGLVRAASAELGVGYGRPDDHEPEAALRSGGPGRLAACFRQPTPNLGVAGRG